MKNLQGKLVDTLKLWPRISFYPGRVVISYTYTLSIHSIFSLVSLCVYIDLANAHLTQKDDYNNNSSSQQNIRLTIFDTVLKNSFKKTRLASSFRILSGLFFAENVLEEKKYYMFKCYNISSWKLYCIENGKFSVGRR